MRLRTLVPILLLALSIIPLAVPASASAGVADAGSTLRASTATEAGTLVQVAAEPAAPGGPPAWIGLAVLAFGGLIAAFWVGAVVIEAVRSARVPEGPERTRTPPAQNRNRPEDGMPAKWH